MVKAAKKFRILLSFANPLSGKKLARVAGLFAGHSQTATSITALHVTPTADINKYQLSEYEKESFRPIKSEASKLHLDIKTNYKVSNDVSAEILSEANSGEFDIILVGVGQSVFQGSFLGQFIAALNPDKLIGALRGKNPFFGAGNVINEKSVAFINNSKIPVGIFIDHDLETVKSVIVPILSVSDFFLFFYVKKMIRNSNVGVTVLDYNGVIAANAEIKEELAGVELLAPDRLTQIDRKAFSSSDLNNYDLVVLSMEGYAGLSEVLEEQEEEISSMLLMRP